MYCNPERTWITKQQHSGFAWTLPLDCAPWWLVSLAWQVTAPMTGDAVSERGSQRERNLCTVSLSCLCSRGEEDPWWTRLSEQCHGNRPPGPCCSRGSPPPNNPWEEGLSVLVLMPGADIHVNHTHIQSHTHMYSCVRMRAHAHTHT